MLDLSWMAWTWPTAAFFAFIIACLIGMSVWEVYAPGGAPRRGILGLETTRGDLTNAPGTTVKVPAAASNPSS